MCDSHVTESKQTGIFGGDSGNWRSDQEEMKIALTKLSPLVLFLSCNFHSLVSSASVACSQGWSGLTQALTSQVAMVASYFSNYVIPPLVDGYYLIIVK